MKTPASQLFPLSALVAVLAAAPFARAETFTLTDKQGRSLTAEVLSVSGDQVKIKRDDGQQFTLSMASLASDDQKKLRDWAKAEASKPLPPGSLQVELSRGIFKTDKQTTDVTVTDGRVIKNGRTVTEEKWGYSITLINKSSTPLEKLRAEYRLFATVDSVHVKEKQGLRKRSFQSPLETVPELGRLVFRTETISAYKMKYNGNIYSAATGDSSSREQLMGIWLRIYRDKELIYESSAPESLQLTEKW